jgi:hypothetical protein
LDWVDGRTDTNTDKQAGRDAVGQTKKRKVDGKISA